ncbi:ATP-binding protein [Kitasatospora sp. NPDC059811]|uniref:ATP-binding protein n=1 Tax=Streptomycetaceae TaxID=2062 RepID=UPI0009A038DC|nr:ATP-binding protein [Streptomyces sp. MJM8645]
MRSRVASWGVLLDEDTRFALDTVTSELVTNAVRHSDRPMLTVAVYVSVRLRRALVEVYDGSTALPRRRQAGTDAESGRGLELVECLALAMTRRQIIAGPRRAVQAALNALERRGRTPIRAPHCPGSTRPAVPAR